MKSNLKMGFDCLHVVKHKHLELVCISREDTQNNIYMMD